jgi:tellurite resistance protein TehA-like permease
MWKSVVEKFPPAYFTMVMATGILSLAVHAQHFDGLANALFYLNLGLFPLFLGLLLARVLGFFAGVKAELTSHEQGATYLAVVACLVGNQAVQLRRAQQLGQGLWVFGAVCWVVLLYSFLLSMTLRRDKPPLETGLGGNWLLLVVATEALAVLGGGLVPHLPLPTELAVFGVLCLFMLGSLFYVVISTLLFYRLTFVRVEEDEVGAPYWISVGGSAITVLAGAGLLPLLPQVPALASVAGFVKGWIILFWVVSTWWIPFVTVLRAWYHLRARPAFSYKPTSWNMVFPLGMYTAATGRLADVLPLPLLKVIPAYSIYVALLAWGLTLLGMLYHLFASAKPAQAPAQG